MYVSLCTYCKALLMCVNIEINIKRKVCSIYQNNNSFTNCVKTRFPYALRIL